MDSLPSLLPRLGQENVFQRFELTLAERRILLSRGEAGIYFARIRRRELEEDSMSCSSGRAKFQSCLASVLVFAGTLHVQAAGPGKHVVF